MTIELVVVCTKKKVIYDCRMDLVQLQSRHLVVSSAIRSDGKSGSVRHRKEEPYRHRSWRLILSPDIVDVVFVQWDEMYPAVVPLA